MMSSIVAQVSLSSRIAAMFSQSQQGAWYDPSAFSTLFQDSTGTTPVTAVEQFVGLMRDKSGRGNHASQATAGNRPLLSARVNLLVKTEDLTDGAWIKVLGCTATSNVVTFNTTNDNRVQQTTNTVSVANQQWLCSVELSGVGTINLNVGDDTGAGGYSEPTITLTSTPTRYSTIWTVGAGPTGNVRAMLIWRSSNTAVTVTVSKFDIRLSGTPIGIPAYQRVNTATDYDTVGFPDYLALNGTSSSLASATGGGGTAGFMWCTAVSPNTSGTTRTIWSDVGANTGHRVRINTSNQLELAAGNGTAYTLATSTDLVPAGSTSLITAWDDGTNLNVQVNSGSVVSVARPVVAAGTAGFAIGTNNGTPGNWFAGNLYASVSLQSSPTAIQRAQVQAFVRSRAGL